MLQFNIPFIEPVSIKKGDDVLYIYVHLRDFHRECDEIEGTYDVSRYELSYWCVHNRGLKQLKTYKDHETVSCATIEEERDLYASRKYLSFSRVVHTTFHHECTEDSIFGVGRTRAKNTRMWLIKKKFNYLGLSISSTVFRKHEAILWTKLKLAAEPQADDKISKRKYATFSFPTLRHWENRICVQTGGKNRIACLCVEWHAINCASASKLAEMFIPPASRGENVHTARNLTARG